jgi:hypothetical protein
MLATAMSSTNNTAPVNIHSAVRVRAPVTWTLNGTTLMPRDADPAGGVVHVPRNRAHFGLRLLD